MYAFVKWQSSEFVVTSEKECRPVDNRTAKKKQTTQIAWYILFETDFSSFSLFTLLLQLHSTTIRLLFLFVKEFFFVWVFIIHIKYDSSYAFSKRTLKTLTTETNFAIHFMSYRILFVYIIVCQFFCLAKLPDVQNIHCWMYGNVLRCQTKLWYASHFTKLERFVAHF